MVRESDLEAVKRELINHKRLTLAEPGCLIFTVTQDHVNTHKFSVYEEFVHQSSVKSSTWGGVSRNVERH